MAGLATCGKPVVSSTLDHKMRQEESRALAAIP